jgi:Tfp pilus assembly PilM family ATPase
MSVFGHSAIGIDVSDGTLKAVELQRRGRRLTLRRTWRMPLAGDTAEERADAVAAFLRRARPAGGTRLVLPAPAEESATRTFVVPVMDAARVAELVRYELLSELGLPEEDLLIRHLARPGEGDLPVLAYALRRRRVDQAAAALRERGVDVDAWELPGFALASFVDLELPGVRDRIVLGVGRTASDLVLMAEGGLWARHLGVGLQSATAEELAARLRAEVDAAVAALLPGDQPFRPQHVVLTEEGALDAAFAGALKKALELPLARVDTLRRMHASMLLQHDEQTPEQALSSARAFGLALAGLEVGAFRCPAVTGGARREALRLVPVVTACVLVSAATLVLLGEQARARARELQETLSIASLGDLLDRTRHRDELRQGTATAQAQADRLLALAQRRANVLLPRRALAAVSAVAGEREGQTLHLERLWLDAGEPGQAGALALTLHAAPEFDATLGERLQRALAADFADIEVHGPEPAPVEGLSQWTVKVVLP